MTIQELFEWAEYGGLFMIAIWILLAAVAFAIAKWIDEQEGRK